MTSKLVKNNSGREVQGCFLAGATWVMFNGSGFLSEGSDTHLNPQISCRSYLAHSAFFFSFFFLINILKMQSNNFWSFQNFSAKVILLPWSQGSCWGVFILSGPVCRTPCHSLKPWQHHLLRTMWSIQKPVAMNSGDLYRSEYPIWLKNVSLFILCLEVKFTIIWVLDFGKSYSVPCIVLMVLAFKSVISCTCTISSQQFLELPIITTYPIP